MFLKTTKPSVSDGDVEEKINVLICYLENLKEEISFRLELLSTRADTLQIALDRLKGGTQ